jgi:hypothetical protein
MSNFSSVDFCTADTERRPMADLIDGNPRRHARRTIAGCEVLKRSMAELCTADHKNDPAILARWLGDKTIENFAAWAEKPDSSLLVAIEEGHIGIPSNRRFCLRDRNRNRVHRRRRLSRGLCGGMEASEWANRVTTGPSCSSWKMNF